MPEIDNMAEIWRYAMFRFCFLLTALAFAAPVFAQSGYEAMAAKARSSVAHGLKDPDSAKFRNLAVYKSTTGKGGVTLCGEVNAKNSFGAYVGFKRFMLWGENALIEGQEYPGLTYDDLGHDLCYTRVARVK